MRIQVLFFGQLRDLFGRSNEPMEMPEGAKLQDVFDVLAERVPRLRELDQSVVIARNQEFAPRVTQLQAGDEVALLPPVSGGTGRYTHQIDDPDGHFFALTRERIDSAGLAQKLLRGEDGALITFDGVVRNNTKGRATKFLDYECYEAMAVKVMAQIGRDIAASHSIGRIAMVHRLGRMEIGEASVTIIVTSPHRGPAFAAALEGINRLKKLVPVWKKEHFVDGEVWVDGEWDDAVVQR